MPASALQYHQQHVTLQAGATLVTNGGGATGRRRSTTVGIDVSIQTSSLPFPVAISISSPLIPLSINSPTSGALI